MAKKVTLKDKDDEVLYPQTVVGSVYDANGTALDGFKVVNDLTTGGTTSALSAEQGKVLNAFLSGDTITTDGMSVATKVEGYYIGSSGEPQRNRDYDYYVIPVKTAYHVSGYASCYTGYPIVAYYTGDVNEGNYLSSRSVIATVAYTGEEYSSDVPAGCRNIVVVQCKVTGHGDIGETTATVSSYDPDSSLIGRVAANSSDISDLKESTEQMKPASDATDIVFDYSNPDVKKPEEFTVPGYYNHEDTNTTPGYNFASLPIIHVVEGQTIYWHKWINTDSVANSLAVACYDNDGLPFNGTDSWKTYDELTSYDFDAGEYSLVIPSNCSQIGLSYSTDNTLQDGANIVIGDFSVEFSERGVQMVQSAVGSGSSKESSADYYLKGNSNVKYLPSKKLCVIAGGQSNIDGRDALADLPADFVNPNSKVHFCNNTNGTFSDFQIVSRLHDEDWSFDAIVYDLLTKSQYGNQDEIYVIKKSMGGVSIDKDGATDYHWTADYEELSNESYSLLRTFEASIRKAKETQGENFDIKAFIWHQGEGDSDTFAVANRYYDNLKNMLAYVRGVVGNPRLHFFCGSISNNNTYNQYKNIVNAAYEQLAEEDYYFHLVDMSGATLKDSWHFDAESSIYFGQKVYDLMIDFGILSGTKVNPVKPWE